MGMALARLRRYTLATLFWILTTQWFFGQSILDRVLHATGSCTLNQDPSITEIYTTARSCKKSGGEWTGFDVSGHCLLLIHCGVLLLEELRVAKVVGDFGNSVVKGVMGVSVAFLGLWWFLLMATAIHFHDLPEKVCGTALTVVFEKKEAKTTNDKMQYASRKSKMTFAGSILFTTLTIFGVYKLKEYELKVRRQGIVRDDERRRQILENDVEYERNEALQRRLLAEQQVSETSV
ncbi:UNVERIFIED_CONTAM: fat storage-inducing transmembrane protein 2 [Siphonaria sp. JEL0065]|nr:fat storage-inducing transmembrane protein 2 [Siphonaria sp. JEL0065]